MSSPLNNVENTGGSSPSSNSEKKREQRLRPQIQSSYFPPVQETNDQGGEYSSSNDNKEHERHRKKLIAASSWPKNENEGGPSVSSRRIREHEQPQLMSGFEFFQKDSGQASHYLSQSKEGQNSMVTGLLAPPRRAPPAQPAPPPPSQMPSPLDAGNLIGTSNGLAVGDSVPTPSQSVVQLPTVTENQHRATNGAPESDPTPKPGQPSSSSPAEAPGVGSRDTGNSPPINNSSAGDQQADVLASDDGLEDYMRLFLRLSPAGFHITNVPRFMQSDVKTPPGQIIGSVISPKMHVEAIFDKRYKNTCR